MSETQDRLSLEQKQDLYHDGFIVLKNVVPKDLIQGAINRIKKANKGENLGGEKQMTNLVNASPITPILHEVMGYFDPPVHCQVGVLKQSEPGDHFNNVGYRDKDMPYYGTQVHMDGSQTIAAPQEVQEGTEEEIYYRYIASGPKGDSRQKSRCYGPQHGAFISRSRNDLRIRQFYSFCFCLP